VAAVALIFALGTGFGYTLPRSGGSDPAPPVSTQAPRAHTVTSVPEACLETARKGDQMVHLFIVNDRSRRLAHRPSATPGQQGTTAVNKRPARQPSLPVAARQATAGKLF
jgi:hypothetical protein